MLDEATLPTEAQTRVDDLRSSCLQRELNQELQEFQHAIQADPVVDIVDVYAVGSVLTTKYQSEESDLDVFLITNKQPHKDVIESFPRSWDAAASRLYQEDIAFEPTKVDIVGIQSVEMVEIVDRSESALNEDSEISPPYYKL